MFNDMRVLIQNCDTMKFFAAESGWTGSPQEATDYEGTLAAVRAIRERSLRRAQIVLKFERAEFDVVLQTRECKDLQRN